METVKKHYLKILNIIVFFTFLLSCYACFSFDNGENLRFFGEDFFLYGLRVYDTKIFVVAKAFVFLFVLLSILLVDFELKEYPHLSRIVSLSFFTGVLLVFAINAEFETILIFLTILFFSLMKRFFENYNFKYAFLFMLCHSLLLVLDFKTLALTISFFIVLFLTDDILKVIDLRKIFSLKCVLGLVLGSLPLLSFTRIDFLLPLRDLTGDFLIDTTGYLYKLAFAKPLLSFNGTMIISIFMPSFFLFCGLFSLAKIEVFGNEKEGKKDTLSSAHDVCYYLSLWYPFIFLMIFSFLIKKRVSFLFLYPLITPLPFLMAKALKDALPFFSDEKEKKAIKVISLLVSIGVVFIGMISGFRPLRNQVKINEVMPLVDIIKANPEKSFLTTRYSKILNYLTMLDNAKDFKVNFKDKDISEMIKGYDYYIPANAKEDNDCFVIVEPDMSFLLKKNVFVKSWLCERPYFVSDTLSKNKKIYIFKIENINSI